MKHSFITYIAGVLCLLAVSSSFAQSITYQHVISSQVTCSHNATQASCPVLSAKELGFPTYDTNTKTLTFTDIEIGPKSIPVVVNIHFVNNHASFVSGCYSESGKESMSSCQGDTNSPRLAFYISNAEFNPVDKTIAIGQMVNVLRSSSGFGIFAIHQNGVWFS